MSGWGLNLVGFASTIDVLESLSMQWDGDTLYVAGPTVNYAIYQEEGTSSIDARPFMKPAAERVESDVSGHAEKMAATHGIDISSEEGLLRAIALAVQNEGKQIADRKGIRDTGTLIASISMERVN